MARRSRERDGRDARRTDWIGLGLLLSGLATSITACEDTTRVETSGGTNAGSPSATVTTSQGAGGGAVGAGGAATTSAGGMGAGAGGPTVNPCTDCSAPMQSGTVANPAIDEASGLVASTLHPGIFFVHNDSGDSPRIFAIDRMGAERGEWNIVNAKAVDWEDMAAGPCDDGRCLFVADFGDNLEQRDDYVVYRLKEPAMIGGGPSDVTAQAFPFEYPDGSHNAEALIADPTTGQLYVLTKVSSGASALYRFPEQLDPDQTAVLTKVGSFDPPQGVKLITAADAHQHGVLVRTYTQLYYFRYVQGDIAASIATTPCLVPKAFEIQGETVAWSADGTAYYTVSEGKSVPVNEFLCTTP